VKLPSQFLIFVVDDEVNHLKLLQMRLLSLGFGVETASNGLVALEKMRTSLTPVDLIVTDMMMPGMGGVTLLQTLRDDPKFKNIPLIAMTGFPEKQLIDQSLKYGVTDFLLKPFPFDELMIRVKAHLSLS
jgi:CheY-like chemotaxis protein